MTEFCRRAPFLRELLRGGARVVAVGEVRHLLDHAIDPCEDDRKTVRNPRGSVGEAAVLTNHAERHAVAQVAELLAPDRELHVHTEPIFKEAAYRLAALQEALGAPVEQRIRGIEALHQIEVPCVERLDVALETLSEIGRRRLLAHGCSIEHIGRAPFDADPIVLGNSVVSSGAARRPKRPCGRTRSVDVGYGPW